MKSKPFTLNATDVPALLKALLVGLAIAVLTFVGEFITSVDFGDLTPVIMGIVPPILTTIVRFLRNNDAE